MLQLANGKQQFLDQNGAPLAGGLVYHYAPGTTNPVTTYKDSTGQAANPNPIPLDSRGQAVIWGTGTFRQVVTDASGVTIWDQVVNAPDVNAPSNSLAAQLLSWLGATLIGFIQAGAGAVRQTIQDVLRLSEVNVESFGAKGDGITDDWAAITACLAATKARGCNVTVRMSQRYMISKGIKIPSYVRIKGPMPSRYPYNNASPAPALVANFADPNQWVIEPETTSEGKAVLYNTALPALPDGATYNCAIEDLLITSVGVTPYGAIRMHGCPGSVVKNVSTLGTGIGLLVNECFGGDYQVHGEALYYGAIMWGEANANKLDAYYDQAAPRVKAVPAAYQFQGVSSLNGTFVANLKLATEAHYNRPFGLVVGANPSTSSNNEISITTEGFSGGVFMFNARSAQFTRLYIEGSANEVDYGIVAALSTFNSDATHAYFSATGSLFDLGTQVNADMNLNGIISYANFGNGPYIDSLSFLTLRGVQPESTGIVMPRLNVLFPSGVGAWVPPALGGTWTNAGGANAVAGYRKNPQSENVELKGYIIGGNVGVAAFTLPVGYRPSEKRNFVAISSGAGGNVIGYVIVLASGEVIPAAPVVSASGVSLDGITFRAEQ